MNLKRMLPLLVSLFLLTLATVARADVWTPTSRPPKEVGGRQGHTAVWTGREMIVWGGFFGSNGVGYGGVYDLTSDTWRPTSLQNLPKTYLGGHTAVWAGEPVNRMLVYGGGLPQFGLDGGMYDPASDVWTVIDIDGDKRTGQKPPDNVPSFRAFHSAVWTGEEMIVWGGHCISACHRGDGAAFNPLTKSWRPIPTPSFLAPRKNHSAFWTGTEMIVWGGSNGSRPFNDGGIYDPKRNEWKPISMAGAPSLRSKYSAVWTGSEMIVWGGQETLVVNGLLKAGPQFLADGRIYDPALDRWRPMSTKGLPVNAKRQALGREMHTAVWTGEEMIVWGGQTTVGVLNMGHRYNPVADAWLTVTNNGAPTNRTYHTAVWTGTAMVVWAGRGGGGLYGYAGPTGGVYRPTCGAFIIEPRDGDRVDRRVKFRLHASPAGATRQVMLFVDGVPYDRLWHPVESDSSFVFTLGDELRGPHKLQVRTAAGVGGSECHSPEVSVVVGPTIKVLSLIFDPKFEFNGKTYRETFNWHNPKELTTDYYSILLEASGGFAKYELVGNKVPPEAVEIDGYPKESNGYVHRDEELYNQSRNRGWANLEGVPQGDDPDTQPNHGFPLGSSAATMRYSQTFKVWGRGLKKIKVGLSKVGSPTQPVKISVRREPDGDDVCSDIDFDVPKWCGSVVRPAEVLSTSHLAPTYVELTKTDGKEFKLPLDDRLYYLVIQFSDNPATPPDPHNFYVISATRDPGTTPGRARFTDEEATMFMGTDRHADWDLTVKLLFYYNADYEHLLSERVFEVNGKTQSVAAHVREGAVDEVHVFMGPVFNLAEGVMFGPRAFTLVEGPYLPDLDSGRAFVLMGFNYERPVGLMLHNYGHRTEATMRYIYGSWHGILHSAFQPKPVPIDHNWDKFSLYARQVSDQPLLVAGCGDTHNPPNSRNDGDYVNIITARSTCDEWKNYPNLRGVSTAVGFLTWAEGPLRREPNPNPDITQRFYFKWWFTRVPKAKGRNTQGTYPDGKLNNWWRYIVEPDYYKR